MDVVMLEEREWDTTVTNIQTYNASEHGSYGFSLS